MSPGPGSWTSGKAGQLSPWEKAKVYGMHIIAKQKGWKLSAADIRKAVKKTGKGGKRGASPTEGAINKLRKVIDTDPDWHPGKAGESAKRPGPKPKLTEQKKVALGNAAMALKKQGYEPTAGAVIARCPKAAVNPDTGMAFDAKLIREVFRTKCYDLNPDCPWDRVQPLCKTAMPGWLMQWREAWGKQMADEGLPASWFQRHCIWMDPCSTVIPASPRAIFDQSQANQGKGPRWMSKDARVYSRNLRAAPYAGKQASWGDKRVWWFMVFARGKVRLPIMKDGWEQNAEGMATMVNQLPKLLKAMLGNAAKPRVLLTDRGPGFYNGNHGIICQKYSSALTAHGFRPFAGRDASSQPPDIADLLLHESVAAGVRKYFRGNPVKWGEDQEKNVRAFTKNLKECEKYLNQHHDLTKLSLSFPRRVQKLVKEKGRRQRW